MSTRHGMLIGVVSSLFTLLIVFALMPMSGTARAENSQPFKPAEGGRNLVLPTPESPEYPDENAGGPRFPFVSESAAPDAIAAEFHIAGSAFVPMYSDSGVNYAPWGCMYMTGPHDSSNYSVVLPSTATVTFLRLYYVDSSATYNGTMQFAEYNDGQNGSYQATLQTTGSGGWGTTTLSGLSIPLDYANYSYVLYWDTSAAAGSSVQLCGMRIGYTVPLGIYLPLIKR